MNYKAYFSALVFLGTCLPASFAQEEGRVEEFPLQEVRLLDGPFKHACDVDIDVLLQYDTDRLLAPFFKEAGLPLKA